jgi:hypothetical protein
VPVSSLAGAIEARWCRWLYGVTQVAASEVEHGMRRLDAATAAALAGDVGDSRVVQSASDQSGQRPHT